MRLSAAAKNADRAAAPVGRPNLPARDLSSSADPPSANCSGLCFLTECASTSAKPLNATPVVAAVVAVVVARASLRDASGSPGKESVEDRSGKTTCLLLSGVPESSVVHVLGRLPVSECDIWRSALDAGGHGASAGHT
jgi:hypothetical protein